MVNRVVQCLLQEGVGGEEWVSRCHSLQGESGKLGGSFNGEMGGGGEVMEEETRGS